VRAIYLHTHIPTPGKETQSGQDCRFSGHLSCQLRWLIRTYRSYVEAQEIFAYFKECAVKWDCMRYIKLSTRVVEARWSEEDSRWNLKIEDLNNGRIFDDHCDVLLSATGILKYVL
jgi:cation diffusion facilitator CzcD-associated flavoprotein CzcO